MMIKGYISHLRLGIIQTLVLLLGILFFGVPQQLRAQSATKELKPRHKQFLKGTEVFILPAERAVFKSLDEDYQRDAFISRFWRERDPWDDTARNEWRDRWDQAMAVIPGRYESFKDSRAKILLVHGEPTKKFEVRCAGYRVPVEIWSYRGSYHVSEPFVLVFDIPKGQPARLFQGAVTQQIRMAENCFGGQQLTGVLNWIKSRSTDYGPLLAKVLQRPQPRSSEWLAVFQAHSTTISKDVDEMDGDFEVVFPGRRNQRSVVQGVLTLDPEQAAVVDLAGNRTFDFRLTGEVIHQDQLLDSFRYTFSQSVDQVGEKIYLAFDRYLRPGDYRLILRVEDLNARFPTFWHQDEELVVPFLEKEAPRKDAMNEDTARLLAEVEETLSEDGASIRIFPPGDTLLTGLSRFDAEVRGEVERVRFFLNDREVMTRTRAPYSVELDLGSFPLMHKLRAEVIDAQGRVVTDDEILINVGKNHFAIRLLSPRPGKRYERSLLARAEVKVPDGRSLERVEFFVGDHKEATLFQPPWEQPLLLPSLAEIAFIRAVAYLPDGSSTEDMVFVNAPPGLEEVRVQAVEVYASVFDRSKRPVEDLDLSDFRVLEEGKAQAIRRFEEVSDLPIHTAVLIDNSASMRGRLSAVRKAAVTFFQSAISSKDRAALITFNRFPRLVVPLTSDVSALGGGLAGLTAEADTSLYDSLIFGLYYLGGIKGQRALLVLSDGRDEGSRATWEETAEYARRAGVMIYTIGLDLPRGKARSQLQSLAKETGGASYFLKDSSELPRIYAEIEETLRSQYLLVYQSDYQGKTGEFRKVEVEVDRPGATVRAMSGYYP